MEVTALTRELRQEKALCCGGLTHFEVYANARRYSSILVHKQGLAPG